MNQYRKYYISKITGNYQEILKNVGFSIFAINYKGILNIFYDFTETKAELNGGRAQGSSALGAVTGFDYPPP